MAVTGMLTPKYRPGSIVTFTTSAAVTKGAPVAVSGSGTVATAAAASQKIVGIALQTASASGDKISVQLTGYVFVLTAKGAITAGNLIGAASDGSAAVSAVTVDTTGTLSEATVEAALGQVLSVIGIALEDIADTANGPIYVKG